jgi:hypothetical protein
MTLKYKLQFFDYWHVSSGISAGAKLDLLVVKDKDKLPFVGGKTIKGLLREMAELFNEDDFIIDCFGKEGVEMGKLYFNNATLDKEIANTIILKRLQNNLYNTIASTSIDSKTEIAIDDTLREIEVTIPLTLNGEISDIPTEESMKKVADSLKMIKRVGINRNRGLGRCQFIVEEMKI